VWVIPTDEEQMIARQTIGVLTAERRLPPGRDWAHASNAAGMEKQV
jgi:hypothetical protein